MRRSRTQRIPVLCRAVLPSMRPNWRGNRLGLISGTAITLLLAAAVLARAEDRSTEKKPRFLTLAAKAKAQQTGGATSPSTDGVTPPVARRPAGHFEMPVEPTPQPAPQKEVSQEPVPNQTTNSAEPKPEEAPPKTPLATGNTYDERGRIYGTSVAERVDGMRHRSVEAKLGQSFVAADPPPETLQEEVVTPLADSAANATDGGVSTEVTDEENHPGGDLVAEEDPSQCPTPATPELATGSTIPELAPVRTLPLNSASEYTPGAATGRDLLFSNRAPAISFETLGPRRIVIGKEAAYRVIIKNSGDMDASNVIVHVELPPWAEVVGSGASTGTPQVESEPSHGFAIEWRIAKLAARGQESLMLSLIPRDSRPFDLAVGWAFAPETGTAMIEVQEPKLEMTISGPDEVMYGATEVYTITLSNPGSGDAENVVLNLLPVSAHQQMVGTRNIGTLRQGERKNLEIELTAHQAGRLQVKAMAYADGGLRAESIQDVVVHRANLEVALMGPPKNFAATAAIYRVRVENTGDASAESTVVVAALPRGTVCQNATDGGRVNARTSTVEWQIGSLRAGAVRVLEMQVELNQAGDNRFDVQCRADRDLSVTRTIVTHVEALADLKLHVNDPPGAVSVGTDAIYEVRILNRGTKAAENVSIMGYFSEGIEPVSVRGCRATTSTGQVELEPIAQIGPGQEIVFRVTARALQPGDHVFRAELTCKSPETRLASEEWTKYFQSVPDGMPEHVARQTEPLAPPADSEGDAIRLEPLR